MAKSAKVKRRNGKVVNEKQPKSKKDPRKPVKRTKRVVRRPKYLPGQRELAEVRQLVSDMNYKLVTEEMRRTKALEDIASSLRVMTQYVADFATRFRVVRMFKSGEPE